MRARAGAVLAAFHEGAGAGIHEGVHEGGGIREDLHIYIYRIYMVYIRGRFSRDLPFLLSSGRNGRNGQVAGNFRALVGELKKISAFVSPVANAPQATTKAEIFFSSPPRRSAPWGTLRVPLPLHPPHPPGPPPTLADSIRVTAFTPRSTFRKRILGGSIGIMHGFRTRIHGCEINV